MIVAQFLVDSRQTCLIVIGWLSFSSIWGQSSYIITDTSIIHSRIILDKGAEENSKYCYLRQGKTILRYSPSEIQEYCIKAGQIYRARDLMFSDTVQRVFLEVLVDKESKLYYLKRDGENLFFFESNVHPLTRMMVDSSYLRNLLADCPYMVTASKLVRPTKHSLTTLVLQYNECKPQLFPSLKYGIAVFTGLHQLSGSSRVGHPALQSTTSPFKLYQGMGGFLDIPLYKNTVALRPTLFYSKTAFNITTQKSTDGLDYILNTSSLTFPISLRYNFNDKKSRFFATSGLIYSLHFKNQNNLFTYKVQTDHIQINNLDNTEYYSKHQLGFSGGMGYEYPLNYKQSLLFELQVKKHIGLGELNTLSKSEIILMVSINL